MLAPSWAHPKNKVFSNVTYRGEESESAMLVLLSSALAVRESWGVLASMRKSE